MNSRTTQLIRGDIFTQHAFNNARPGEPEKSVFGLNQEATLPRQITTATGIESEHAHNTGHNPADFSQRGEGVRITVQATYTGRNVSTRRIIQPD